MYERADWKSLHEKVSARFVDDASLDALSAKDELEEAADGLEALANELLEKHVARAQPPPYAKRWWTDELKALRLSLSAARNHLNTVRRGCEDVAKAAASVGLMRRIYMDKIEQRVRQHRTEFLDNRNNVWKAYACTKASHASRGIPVLKAKEYRSDG